MPCAAKEATTSVTTADRVCWVMLTVPGHAACSWEHETVTGGSVSTLYAARDARRDRCCHDSVGGERQVVAMLLEAADRQHSDERLVAPDIGAGRARRQ